MLKGGYEKKCADMLPGLKEGQDKMSKSDTSSTIFMEDEEPVPDHFKNDENAKVVFTMVKDFTAKNLM
ncbi:putative rossmann-like alpha/beta/alpha sandwich protein [Helianthus debilis subsp. tardiflorus]